MLKKLNRSVIPTIEERPVKVLQFGKGNFLRGFVDVMIEVMNEKTAFNGDVQVVQVNSQNIDRQFEEQDGLYHVILNGIENGEAVREKKLITCLREVISPFEDLAKYLKAAENLELKFIVSNTTEAGIIFKEEELATGVLPKTFPGKLTIFLWHRYQYFKGNSKTGLTVLPCELIEKNGEALKAAILQYVQYWNLPESFKKWIEEHNTFCNTLVDRIVPGFPKENIKEIQQEIGFEDNLIVTAEPFHLWVIEAPDHVRESFPAEQAGLQVKFAKDLTPYRMRKVRILNGAHSAMVPVAYLRGSRTVRETIDDSFSGDFVRKAIFEEIIPTLDLPKEELDQFANDVIERFRNPYIKHELASIALNSISKFTVRVLPSLLEYHRRKGVLPERLVYALSCLIAFYKGSYNNQVMPVNDTPEVQEFFKQVWAKVNIAEIVNLVLSNKKLWNTDLTVVPGLQSSVEMHLQSLYKEKKAAIFN
jgi:tagaturonate reductase